MAGLAVDDCDHVARAIDANLGVVGLPQSATGQTTLFTGVNAARQLGRHVAAYPGPQLKEIIARSGIMARVRAADGTATLANAYRQDTIDELVDGRRRISANVYLATSAGVALRPLADLRRGRAVSWELERDMLGADHGEDVPLVSAAEAGRDLVGLAADYDLTLFDCFLTDLAGHRRFGLTPEMAVDRVDRFLSGVVEHRNDPLTVVVCSDHGNLEEADHRRHTRNPVPLVALGPAARRFREVEALDGVTPAVLSALGIDDRAAFQ